MTTITKRIVILLAAAALLPLAAPADDNVDKFYDFYKQYTELYNSHGKDSLFYAASERLKQQYIDHKDRDAYYKIAMNEAMYEIDHDRPYLAIKKATEMLNEMNKQRFDGYSMVYMTLGTVFESRGNINMAEHYYKKGIDNISRSDERSQIGAYTRMAYLLKFVKPDEARHWNELYAKNSLDYPPYHQVYLFIAGMISFAKNEREAFLETYDNYHAYRKEHPELDNYGLATMAIMQKAFNGKYQEALSDLDKSENDLDLLARHDLRMHIHEMQNRLDLALSVARQRSWCVDSLNSDMLFNNLNELSTEAELTKMKTETAHERLRLMTIVLVLALLLIVLLFVFILRHRSARHHLKVKNEQLRTALSMAEESDKMKTEFVRSVSHEIRTPLNAINGFNEILNNTDMHLSAEERADLTTRINDNMAAITNIVDEMLQMAEQASTDFYPRTGSIYCNKFLSQILYSYRDTVNPNIELAYTTKVLNRFSFNTNQEGVKKILDHLIQNAIKFTNEGAIEVNCRQSDDLKDVIITVTDTGCGVAEENQDKIFEQFYKVDSFEQGIGLGLTVSRKIARKLGGDLAIDKDYHDGARFVLTLPFE